MGRRIGCVGDVAEPSFPRSRRAQVRVELLSAIHSELENRVDQEHKTKMP